MLFMRAGTADLTYELAASLTLKNLPIFIYHLIISI